MLQTLKKTANMTRTENGAASYRTSGRDCVDLFASVGALRHADEEEIYRRFFRAYAEDGDLAMKILFYARDVRGGLGERRVFRSVLRRLAFDEPRSVLRNLPYIADYGRWDDVLVLLDTPCHMQALELMKAQLEADLAALRAGGEVSLLGKWLPSVNASNAQTAVTARRIARHFGLSEREYRKALSALRAGIRIIENDLRVGDYGFDYSKQPSKAMLKYRKAFLRNDGERYCEYLRLVSRGECTLHTGTLLPYELVERCYDCTEEERPSLDAAWRALEDFTADENALVVADGSGSMYWNSRPTPAAVAQSLAIYFAERSRGAFHNCFITFSETPRLVEIKGRDIVDKVRYCSSFDECANTDIEAVFDLILRSALENGASREELPARLYIISDMEFDCCAQNASATNFEAAAARYAQAGYKLPELIFWNVDSRREQYPLRASDCAAALVSGCSPRVFSMVTSGRLDPYGFMLSAVDTPRYARIAA